MRLEYVVLNCDVLCALFLWNKEGVTFSLKKTATRLSSHEKVFVLQLAYTGTGEENWSLT